MKQANQLKCIDVLDHGYVRLVDHMGSDLSVVRSARVSYDADWRAGVDDKSDTKLIKYLLRNGHTSPFESVTFTFEVKAPIFVFRQWQRHRTWSFNEISARYSELPEEFYLPQIEEITHQHDSNKQMRNDEVNPNARSIHKSMWAVMYEAFRQYREFLDKECPRELARIVLPVATYSRMFATVNLHNLLRFIALRSHEHAQKEIQVYSDAMLKLIEDIVPVSVGAWKELNLTKSGK